MVESPADACLTLGVRNDATPNEVRQAYLQLVRQHPPDRDPERFRQLHAAYQLLSDPLSQAKALCSTQFRRPDLSGVIAAAESQRPRLPKFVLLALGNQD